MAQEEVRVDAKNPQQKLAHRLEIGERIAEGGMSDIYEAQDQNLLRKMALKLIHPELMKSERAIRRMIEEAQITAQLDHPNIVAVHELGLDKQGNLYFTMKRVQGKTLLEKMQMDSRIHRTREELIELIQILLKVCDALAFAHHRGVIHRDLKPDNIMVGEYGEVYLMDWGIARLKNISRPSHSDLEFPFFFQKKRRYTAETVDGMAIGTPHYMSPEQARGDNSTINERSDIFSLGAILYEILTHHPPYLGENYDEVLKLAQEGRYIPLSEFHFLGIPPVLSHITTRAINTDPACRYASVVELREELNQFLHSGWQFPRRTYPAGSLIAQQGSVGNEAFVIISGHCEIFREHQGEKQILARLGPGEVFGEMAVFASQPRMAHVQAIDEVTVVALDRQKIESNEPEMGQWLSLFVKALAERFSDADRKVTQLQQEIKHLKQQLNVHHEG